ncbi:MAG: ABC transporter ATP-binding protein [Planctomycetes bacterium]|nr:ABC transporter ATP-binding protein [Planctomycetota bacterium]
MIRVRGLRKSFGDLVAVDGVDLDAEPGRILAVLGPNGAGKSTTVKCLVGLLEPDAGELVVAGHDLRKSPAQARRALSYVPEVAQLHDALTPLEYLQLRGRLFGLPEARIVTHGEALLDGFGLLERRDHPMAGFSKGMQQKVALASALLTRPRVLILDEPLSGLDVESTLVVKEVVRRFAMGGGTVLYCSHLLDVVESLADRVAVLARGRILAQGTLAELRSAAGAGSDARLDALFQQLTRSVDPVLRAAAILADPDAPAPSDPTEPEPETACPKS